MELKEQVTSLTALKQQHEVIIDNLNSQKLALDKMLGNSIQEIFKAHTDSSLKDGAISKLNSKIQELTNEKALILAELEDVKSKLAKMASDAQY